MSVDSSPLYRLDVYEHASADVVYVTGNIPGAGVDTAEFESEFSSGCGCLGKCDIDCNCKRGGDNYIDNCIVDVESRGLITECHANCACDSSCDNRLVQRGPIDCLTVKSIETKGQGLFTKKFINKGQFICEYAGEVIGLEEAKARIVKNKRLNAMNYVLVVNEHFGERVTTTCIDPTSFGNIGRYGNHSCQPNAELVPVRVEGITPRLCLFAVRDIKVDEEITFHYGGSVSSVVANLSETPCFCNSSNCLGRLPHDPI